METIPAGWQTVLADQVNQPYFKAVEEFVALERKAHTVFPPEGEVLAFDDSFQHEAWNRSDGQRVVLIFEVWSPQLTDAEVVGVTRMLEASQRFKQLEAPA